MEIHSYQPNLTFPAVGRSAPMSSPAQMQPLLSPGTQPQESPPTDQLIQFPAAAGQSLNQLSFVDAPTASSRTQALKSLLNDLRGAPLATQLHQVNTFFNDNIHYISDQQNHGVKDHWQSQRETLQSGQGDCEDYALAKYQALQDLGIPEKELHLFYVKNRNNIAHMVLVHTNAEGKSQVLDNESSRVLPTDQRSDLRPVFGFNQLQTLIADNPSNWVKGTDKPGFPNIAHFRQVLAKPRSFL